MAFEPIAIVGRSCLLPGATTPEALWANVAGGVTSLGSAPAGRWNMPRATALGATAHGSDYAWNDIGGYVRDFAQVFDAGGFLLDRDEILALDPLFQWTLHGVREALRDAGREQADQRCALVMGNLSFPSAHMARFAEHTWLAAQPPQVRAAFAATLGRGRPHPTNRFSSGLPAHLAARALGFADGFALDAACASSLYAIKLACDRLHDGSADLMVAGAVNCTDDLFIHMGFSALSALSRSGQSRPFHRDADGLVPAEGAAFVTLKRLGDAIAAGDNIHGVIRAVGLSNDGRARGLLVPSEEGQVRAIRQAWSLAGLAPESATLVECHATGTPLGDSTEVRSMAAVFGAAPDLPIGSLKSNFGHLITVAGTAGLIKVLGAMAAGVRPATLHAREPIDALQGTPLRLLQAQEAWHGPRRAGISAFGFGGNNAHLVVDAWEGVAPVRTSAPARRSAEPVAIVAVGARVGNGHNTRALTDSLLTGKGDLGPRARIEVALAGLRFPPRDIEGTHAQQLMMLEAGAEACHGITLARERTLVLVGMGCDAEVARSGARWRAPCWLAASGAAPDETYLDALRAAFQVPLTAASVLGTMPNIVANRLNSQLDLAGPSFSVSAEEASGLVALRLAVRALQHHEADAALVGAVDLSHEPVHEAALQALQRAALPGDAAVALVLKRLSDARRDGDPVLALVAVDGAMALPPFTTPATPGMKFGDGADSDVDPTRMFGSPHAAKGLLAVASAALAIAHRARPQADGPAAPWLGARSALVTTAVLGAAAQHIGLAGADGFGWNQDRAPVLSIFSGADQTAALAALAAGRASDTGPARLAIAAAGAAQFSERAAAARRWLTEGGPRPEGVAFNAAPVQGKTAFVFTGAAAAYPGMGRELMLALPAQLDAVEARLGALGDVAAWLFGGPERQPRHPLDRLWGTTILSQLHAEITRRVLRIAPDATIGYSSGETNALFAMGAWQDIASMKRDTMNSPLFRHQLVGDFSAVRQTWQAKGLPGERWASYAVSATAGQVGHALQAEAAVHIMAINAPDAYTIGGEEEACARVVARLPPDCAILIQYEIAVHAPDLEPVRAAWHALHFRPTTPVPGMRFYTCGSAHSYEATAEAAADAITEQALGTLDFVGTVEQAWADGVRIFIEHGPRSLCSGWIARILGAREHLVVALDAADRDSVRQISHAVATLAAAGVPMDTDALYTLLGASAAPAPAIPPAPSVSVPAHWPAVRLPAMPAMTTAKVQHMARAPQLAPVLGRSEPAHQRPAPTKQVALAPAAPAAAANAGAPVVALLPAVAPRSVARPNPPFSNSMPTQIVPPTVTAPPPAHTTFEQQVAELHRDFVVRQSAIHLQFLALRQNAESHLLQAFANLGHGEPDVPVHMQEAPAVSALAASPPPLACAAAAAAAPVPPLTAPGFEHPGPKFSRQDLEHLACGAISTLFGPGFAPQDAYVRQTRMPMPPLLLADRVTGIDAEARSMQTGTIWTETDVKTDSWYLSPEGRMPVGVMIEAGQADLLLISWLGIDLLTRGERVYRLLGCDLTFHASLPVPGDTLKYAIEIDSHARQGDVRMFFFHYDCHIGEQLVMSVRQGQAGFFSDEELDGSSGVLWDAAAEGCDADGRLDPPAAVCTAASFDAVSVQAFSEGRLADCFGAPWESVRSHVRPPRLPAGRMNFLQSIAGFDPRGGPWGRGYLRSDTPIAADDWFFAGHFKNDPCMPGTLMFEGCLQAMSFYMSALGFTIGRDGWRFEPVPEQSYRLRCRGQVRPTSRLLTCEVFVSEVIAGPIPTIFADLLGTVDGVKAFHAKRVGLQLVPDWPLNHWRDSGPARQQTGAIPLPLAQLGGLVGYQETKPVAKVDGFAFDYASLLACAWGKPSDAFGPFYTSFDGVRSVARLPGPPYHFMSRILHVDGPQGGMKNGSKVEAEYDVPREAWYFAQNSSPSMPLSILMEVALQPCGWLASYVGSALSSENDLLFRNLDGQAAILAQVTPATRTIRTHVELKSISRNGDMIIQSFHLECFADDAPLLSISTVFGFFPKEAFANQVGMPPADGERTIHDEPGSFHVDLRQLPARYCDGALRMPTDMLLMLDRVTGYWPQGGKAALGRLRAEKDIRAGEWFFKAHFFQDPVQPGSLGIEAMYQLLQFYIIERGIGAGLAAPRFELLASTKKLSWKYRGQVVPTDARVWVDLEIASIDTDARGTLVIADAWLWVDQKRIYQCRQIGMRVVSAAPA